MFAIFSKFCLIFSSGMDLLKIMLKKDPTLRPAADKIVSHPFFLSVFPGEMPNIAK